MSHTRLQTNPSWCSSLEAEAERCAAVRAARCAGTQLLHTALLLLDALLCHEELSSPANMHANTGSEL